MFLPISNVAGQTPKRRVNLSPLSKIRALTKYVETGLLSPGLAFKPAFEAPVQALYNACTSRKGVVVSKLAPYKKTADFVEYLKETYTMETVAWRFTPSAGDLDAIESNLRVHEYVESDMDSLVIWGVPGPANTNYQFPDHKTKFSSIKELCSKSTELLERVLKSAEVCKENLDSPSSIQRVLSGMGVLDPLETFYMPACDVSDLPGCSFGPVDMPPLLAKRYFEGMVRA
jgi:hypothetical protein